MNRISPRVIYLAVAVVLVLSAMALGPSPAVGGECVCSGGFNYAYDEKPCSSGGSNCMVCECPPTEEHQN